jgi:dihydrofolate reductase
LKIALIVAAARNNTIGRANKLPWHIPQDLKYFKAVTMGKPIIMGRKTYESIGKPLPGRTNIVITRQPQWSADGVLVVPNLQAAFALAEEVGATAATQADETVVIGGAEVYRESLPYAERIYLTKISDDVEGDAFFPELSSAWKVLEVTKGAADSALAYEFQILERTD